MDLFCPATVVFARHGEADYVERFFSDEGGTLTARGRQQAAALADSVASRRVSRVWCSDASRAVQTAEIAAARLGVDVVARKSLREIFIGDLLGHDFDVARLREVTDAWAEGRVSVGFPGGETGLDVITRYRGQLDAIADQHRGETVLVVGHESAMCAALPGLADNLRPPYDASMRSLVNGETVEIEVDAEGARLVRWGERRLEA